MVYHYNNAFANNSKRCQQFLHRRAVHADLGIPGPQVQSPNPSIPANVPLGSVGATITPNWSDGSPFTGTLSLAQPYCNDSGMFALSGNNLMINPSGRGPIGDKNTVQDATIVAIQ